DFHHPQIEHSMSAATVEYRRWSCPHVRGTGRQQSSGPAFVASFLFHNNESYRFINAHPSMALKYLVIDWSTIRDPSRSIVRPENPP
ncbi:hypothetical protein, partial [Rhizobium leguminosarum]|uniref:hypothetical protein n=1 Tax=Rhizobium leguminosarum TaxID=384 RepID=UPI003F9A6D44